MSKKKRLIWYTLIGFVLLMQVFPADAPAVSSSNPNDLLRDSEIPVEIATMLRTACYDCHSMETKFPWYSYVAPVKWLINRDTKEGRKELNFSNWNELSKMDQASLLDEISTEVLSGDMPMKIYPIMHADAKLSDVDRQKLSDWAESYAEALFE
jgi:hypothetical protein